MTSSGGSRFPVLTGVAVILEFAGWAGVGSGVVLSFTYAANLASARGEPNFLQILFVLLPGIGLCLGGFLVVAIGEAARVFVSMENNTYRLVQQSLPDHRSRLAEGQ